MPSEPNHAPPGRGLLGWLGRQVGHVKKAVRTDPATAYERTTVTEVPHPADPRLTLRRTTVDEVVVRPNIPVPNSRLNRPARPPVPSPGTPGEG